MKIDRNERFLALIAATGHFAYFVWFSSDGIFKTILTARPTLQIEMGAPRYSTPQRLA
jgi:hypothetical protein